MGNLVFFDIKADDGRRIAIKRCASYVKTEFQWHLDVIGVVNGGVYEMTVCEEIHH